MIDFRYQYDIKMNNNILDYNDNDLTEINEENVDDYKNDDNYDYSNNNFKISYCENICENIFEGDSENKVSLFYDDDDEEEFYHKNSSLKDFEPINLFQENSTKSDSEKAEFISKKRENDKNQEEDQFKPEDIDNTNVNKNNSKNKPEEIKAETNTKTTQNTGRRKKDIKYKTDAEHTKSSEDNVVRKVKTRLVEESRERLNNSIKHNSGEFLPLTPKINVNLKRDINLAFLDRTIADIYSNTDLNKRYIRENDHNKKLIEKIFKENIEKETIEILKKTFRDFLKETREKNLEDFLNKIKTKEIKNGNKKENENEEYFEENIDEDFDNEAYMSKVRSLLFGYEDWFFEKKGRKKKQN